MQVRLDDEVATELVRRANLSGRSASSEANAWLRRALNLAPGVQSPAASRHLAPASIGAASGNGPLPRSRR